MFELKEIKRRIVDAYDPDALVDILGISTEELVERFEDKVVANITHFVEETYDEEAEDENW